jgi:hypothetical protein
MRLVWLSVFFSLTFALFGQIEVMPIIKESKSSPKRQAGTSAFTTLPFWDDFSTSNYRPGDQWEFSQSVEISSGLPSNAPTYKAATLDGVDSTGAFYSDSEKFAGRTDQLISKAIDLSSMSGDESIYLSFFWEAGGNGERPEDESDSLRLQLLNQDSLWVTAWKMAATQVLDFENFTQEIVKINSNFRHEDFRFKFEIFGTQQGRFDTWHIDYVYMNNGRTANDLTYLDRAFSGQLQSLVFPYHEMPAHHFFRDPSAFLNLQSFTASNLDVTPHTLELDYELKIENMGDTYTFLDDSHVFLSGEIKKDTLIALPAIPAMDPPPDSIVLTNTISSDFNDQQTPVDYRVNDSLTDTLLFEDYYAYDDGEAEFVAGVGEFGSVAIEFVIGEQDTLTHFDIYFPKSHESAVGKTISLNLWRKLDGSDPISSKSYTVQDTDLNRFTRIQIVNPVVVTDTIYVGYKQETNAFFPVGLDRNNQAAKEKMYYLSGNTWLQNELANGVMMIRPVFRSLGDLVLNSRISHDLNIYPNPTKGTVTINGDYESLKVLSVSGQLLLDEKRLPTHDLSGLTEGVYLLQIIKSTGKTETVRLVKE